MIVLSNTTPQTLQPGQAIAFDRVVKHTGCAECHRMGTGSVKLRFNGLYEFHFSGNVSSPTADTPVSLAVAIGGEVLPETIMVSTSPTADAANNVATASAVSNCCGDYDRLTVVNNGTAPITVGGNSCFYVKRVG